MFAFEGEKRGLKRGSVVLEKGVPSKREGEGGGNLYGIELRRRWKKKEGETHVTGVC